MKELKPTFRTKISFDAEGYLRISQKAESGEYSAVMLSPEQTRAVRDFISGSHFEQINLWLTDVEVRSEQA